VDTVVDRQLFELNVFSVVSLSRVVLAYFAQKSPKIDGLIAVTSSIAGLIGAPYSPSYTGSKHALHVIKKKFYAVQTIHCIYFPGIF
jgi:dehydrogenase/reductase SDR family member 7